MSGIRRTPIQRKPHPDARGNSSLPPPTTPMPRGKRIAPRSKRMAAYYREVRVPAVKAAVGDGTNPCQARTPVCTGYVETLHEPASRGRFGGLKAAVAAGGELPTCHRCNEWISEHPREAKTLGLLRSNRG